MVANKRAVAAGHICIDITPLFPKGSAGEAGRILAPGRLVQMDGVDIHPGGAVANTGLAMKRLGVDVRLMGKIGKDELGALILKRLEEHGAAEGMILSDQEKTSYSVVLAIPGIDRIFLHDPGANVTFSGSDLDFEAIKGADLFHFGYPTLMRRMYQNQGEELARMFRRIKEGGTAISLDMAAIDPSSEAAGGGLERDFGKGAALCGFLCAKRRGAVLYAGPGTLPGMDQTGGGQGHHRGNPGQGCEAPGTDGPGYGGRVCID